MVFCWGTHTSRASYIYIFWCSLNLPVEMLTWSRYWRGFLHTYRNVSCTMHFTPFACSATCILAACVCACVCLRLGCASLLGACNGRGNGMASKRGHLLTLMSIVLCLSLGQRTKLLTYEVEFWCVVDMALCVGGPGSWCGHRE